MKIHDISLTISADMPVYPGDAGVRIIPSKRIASGARYNISALHLGSHAGTHVDPPYHFVENGIKVDQVPLETLVGRARVCQFPDKREISADDLEQASIPQGTERLLIGTSNSGLWSLPGFRQDFAYIAPGAARWIVERGIKLVGFDYLSVEKFRSPQAETHLTLLGAGVIIVEGLDLSRISPGEYTLVCLPLKIKDGDGAPARAILVEGL